MRPEWLPFAVRTAGDTLAVQHDVDFLGDFRVRTIDHLYLQSVIRSGLAWLLGRIAKPLGTLDRAIGKLAALGRHVVTPLRCAGRPDSIRARARARLHYRCA